MKSSSNLRGINKQRGGIISALVIIIGILIILHYLGIDLTTLLDKKGVKDFFAIVISSWKIVWQDILIIFKYFKDLINTSK